LKTIRASCGLADEILKAHRHLIKRHANNFL
jgi:hypothetical protein